MSDICSGIVIFLILVGIPACLLFLIILGLTKKKVLVPICCLCGCFVLIGIFSLVGTMSWVRTEEYQEYLAEKEIEESKKGTKVHEEQEKREQVDSYDTSLPGKYLVDFVQACGACGIDFEKVRDIKKLDDWSNGESYSFYYETGLLYNDVHCVHFFDNGKVAYIAYKQDDDVKLYEYGYKALDIGDFYVDLNEFTMLYERAKTVVISSLENPETVEFDTSDGGVFRYKDYHAFRGNVSEKKSYTKREEYEYVVICSYDGNQKYELLCYALDGEVLAGELIWPEFEKEQLPMLTARVDGTILLTHGFVGDYGKTESVDGEEIIRYYLPEGRYKVTCQTRGSGFSIERAENGSKGEQLLFSNIDEVYEIEIKEGDSISLLEYSLLEFKPVTK